ncbi:alpha/beta fold hydrolase [Roseococcus sp.]|uniref:alpha/beta fold hydrolase n=1 Tax=Roseococcus sp. TaxID=2109646 RepID=UPI003BAB93ED
MVELKEAEKARDLDRVNAMKARLFLDGPLAPEGRVTGPARELLLEMNAIALRSPPNGRNLDVAPAFPRLDDIATPSLVICGDLEFPHIQERCCRIAAVMRNGSCHALAGSAHLPSLDRPAEVTGLIMDFIARCDSRSA